VTASLVTVVNYILIIIVICNVII